MELKAPPPVRRLDPGTQVTPRPPGPRSCPRSRSRPAAAAAPATGNRQPVPATPSFAAHRRATLAPCRRSSACRSRSCRSLRPKLAVKSVSLPIRQGEVLALIGPSGCGKTTLLRSLNRLTELTRARR